MSDPLSILDQDPAPNNPYAPPKSPDLEPEPAPEPDLALEPMGFWRRTGARILDMGMHYLHQKAAFVVINFFAGFLVALGAASPKKVQALSRIPWIDLLAGFSGFLLYQVILQAGHGSSPGKLLLGMVVLQENGWPCSLRQAWKRELAYFVDAFLFGAVAAAQMSESPLKQRLGDFWADTVVVSRQSAPSNSLRSGLSFVAALMIASVVDIGILALPYLVLLFRM